MDMERPLWENKNTYIYIYFFTKNSFKLIFSFFLDVWTSQYDKNVVCFMSEI